MPKRRRSRKRRFGGEFRATRLSARLLIGGIASDDVISGNMISTSDAKYRLLSIDGVWSWNDIPATIMGSLMFGVALGDYTSAEIEECLEATTSINQGDMLAREKADRRVRVLGVFPSLAGGAIDEDLVYDGGRKLKVRLNWVIPVGKQVAMWGYNSSPTTYANGSELSFMGNANVVYC